jgi:hypothetical protein
VLYVSFEDDRVELLRRLKACCQYHQLAQSELTGWLFVYNISQGKKLATVAQYGKLKKGELAEELLQIIKAQKIDVILLDPFKKVAWLRGKQQHADRLCGRHPDQHCDQRGHRRDQSACRLGFTITAMRAHRGHGLRHPADRALRLYAV